jgi:hypothetical protein
MTAPNDAGKYDRLKDAVAQHLTVITNAFDPLDDFAGVPADDLISALEVIWDSAGNLDAMRHALVCDGEIGGATVTLTADEVQMILHVLNHTNYVSRENWTVHKKLNQAVARQANALHAAAVREKAEADGDCDDPDWIDAACDDGPHIAAEAVTDSDDAEESAA